MRQVIGRGVKDAGSLVFLPVGLVLLALLNIAMAWRSLGHNTRESLLNVAMGAAFFAICVLSISLLR